MAVDRGEEVNKMVVVSKGKYQFSFNFYKILPRYEPPHGKTNNLHRRKQRRRSASR